MNDKQWKEWLNSDHVKWFPIGHPFCNLEEHHLKMKRRHQRKANKKRKGIKHRNPK